MTNVEQMDYWNGAGGEHWVAEQVRYDEINAEFGARVAAVLAPQPGDRVLDVGCGNGALGLAIAPLVAPVGVVLGLDISGPMIEAAAQRADAARLSNARSSSTLMPRPTGWRGLRSTRWSAVSV
jgi:cyclopropane fatty-acyl-phospholipid synthase-like methyltransferase